MEDEREEAHLEVQDDEIETLSTAARTTELQSFLHLLKGYVGPGCLSLPWAVSQLGILWGILACFVMSVWSSYNCWIVVRLKRCLILELQGRDHHHHTNGALVNNEATFPDVAEWVCGRKVQRITVWSICVQQLAICTVFLSFVGENLQAVLSSVWEVPISHAQVLTLVLPAVMALSFLPNLKALAPVTMVGTCLLMLGLSLLAVVIAQEWPNRPHDNIPIEWSQVPLALCAILYSFEGICLVLPVENSMLRQRHFGPVFFLAMVASALIFAIVSCLSVAAFGKVTNGSITAFLLDHLQRHKGLLLSSNAAVSLSVLVTYPLQLYPCLELLQPLLIVSPQDFQTLPENPSDEYEQGTTTHNHESLWFPMRAKLRVGLVLMTYMIAVAVPNVQTLIALSGALAGSSTALILPPVLEMAWFRTATQPVQRWKIYRSWILLVGGLVFLLIGTISSLADMIRLYYTQGTRT